MAQTVYEGKVSVRFVPTITNIAAPTVAQVTAGTDITNMLTKDGWNPGSRDNKVDSGHLGTAYDGQTIGSYGHDLSLTFFRDDVQDSAWELFPRGTQGYIVFSPFKKGALASGDKVSVFQVQAQEPQLGASGANTRQQVTLSFAVQDANLRATVAA